MFSSVKSQSESACEIDSAPFHELVGRLCEGWLDNPEDVRRTISIKAFVQQRLDENLTADQTEALIESIRAMELLAKAGNLQLLESAHGEEKIGSGAPPV
ncbi:hypothetical protein LCGC14_2416940 [marine sediment metagenome]|uniref:Uncharacterized protein n=1 Tax=marine sediment metagenome TaxID=412755 RepID=A0A0F9E304_9ZZZZ